MEAQPAPVRHAVRQLLLEEPPPLATHWATPFQCIKIHLSQEPISIKQMTTVLPGSISIQNLNLKTWGPQLKKRHINNAAVTVKLMF